jgi:transposase InsO family protein
LALSPANDRYLTMAALDMAIKQRCPKAGLLHHSDQGCTPASEDYQKVLDAHGITCSMSRRGEVLDNATMESWNSTFRWSAASTSPRTRSRRKRRSITSIRSVLQSGTRHSAIGYLSPAAYERTWRKERAA